MSNTFIQTLQSAGMLHAVVATILFALAGQTLGMLGGAVLAPARMSRHRAVRLIPSAYLWLFRGTPELLQLIAWYAVLPLAGVTLSITEIAVIGLGANEAARMTEIIRSGFLSIDRGQRDAARALGLSRWTATVHVLLPQAARVVAPAVGNEINVMFKNTSFLSVIGITELLRQSQLQAETTAQPLGVYLAAAVYYLVITTAWSLVQGRMESRQSERDSRRSFWRIWWRGLTGNVTSR